MKDKINIGVIEASRAGKDIFCEKSIDLDLETVKKTLKIVKEEGAKF